MYQRLSRRPGQVVIPRVIDEYVTGTRTTTLARTHCIGKGTPLRLLSEHGVNISHQHRRS
jgi:hypothetical protein